MMGSASSLHPLLFALLLGCGVGLGLPMGAAVVGAGALYGGSVGVAVVLIGEAIGMLINWNLCRYGYRRWMVHRLRQRRRWRWLMDATATRFSWQTLLLLRLALVPMLVVNACGALSATAWQPYALTSLVLVVRFTLMVQAGALGTGVLRGSLSAQQQILGLLSAVATLALAAAVTRRLRRQGLNPGPHQSDSSA
jgi:uncharacterized membrane protein YdjX (TVP38/TMEM64 family)